MKSIKFPEFGLVETPCGADYYTCPLCYYYCDLMENYGDDDPYSFCEKCKIVFGFGCIETEKGCTDSTYFARLINEFTEIDGEKVNGMPVFESLDDAQNIMPKLQPKFVCMGGSKCKCN